MGSRKVVLITGCSSPQGIGFASARALTRSGHAVHATVRNHANDEALTDGLGETLHVHNLELRDRVQARSVFDAGLAPPAVGYYAATPIRGRRSQTSCMRGCRAPVPSHSLASRSPTRSSGSWVWMTRRSPPRAARAAES